LGKIDLTQKSDKIKKTNLVRWLQQIRIISHYRAHSLFISSTDWFKSNLSGLWRRAISW